MTEEKEIQTLVFFDCEATGLSGHRLTEISLVAVHLDEYKLYCRTLKKKLTEAKDNETHKLNLDNTYPRVMNKLTLAVNPMAIVPLRVEDITGLSNYNLEHQPKFGDGPAETIQRFLSSLPGPVSLIAHNGIKFDFPLLRNEMKKASMSLTSDLLCTDSIVFFRSFYQDDQENSKPVLLLTDTPSNPEVAAPAVRIVAPVTPPRPLASKPTELTSELLKTPEPCKKTTSLLPPGTPVKKDLQQTSLLLDTPPPTIRKKRTTTSTAEDPCHVTPTKLARSSDGEDDLYYPGLRSSPIGFSLGVLHKHLFGRNPVASHGSEIDCLVLLKCLAVFGNSFIKWMNCNSAILDGNPGNL